MNNRNHHNNEPLYNEHPFEGLIERALLHREDESIDTVQHRRHSGVPDHNRARIDLARAGMRCIAAGNVLPAR